MPKRILYLGFSAFSQFGGIEQVNKSWLYALSNLKKEGCIELEAYFLLDGQAKSAYVPSSNFIGCEGNKIKFFIRSLTACFRSDIIIASHIHLAPILFVVSLLNSKKILLQVHGIEVWKKLNFFERWLLKKVTLILGVSNYTKNRLIQDYKLANERFVVLPNCLDPFFEAPTIFDKPEHLLTKHRLNKSQTILFTLSRLSFSEQYKGYDKVIAMLPELKKNYPNIKYLIGGKGDQQEIQRVKRKIQELNIQEQVSLLGFIDEQELNNYYQLADAFVMPSQGEGFGIAFIEAAANGCQVLAGNQDGSVDALRNGELGILVNPNKPEEILSGLELILAHPIDKTKQRDLTLAHFSFETYQKRIHELLFSD